MPDQSAHFIAYGEEARLILTRSFNEPTPYDSVKVLYDEPTTYESAAVVFSSTPAMPGPDDDV